MIELDLDTDRSDFGFVNRIDESGRSQYGRLDEGSAIDRARRLQLLEEMLPETSIMDALLKKDPVLNKDLIDHINWRP